MSKIRIPNYSLGEELINSISHGIGAIICLIGIVFLLIKSVQNGNTITIISNSVYSFSLLILYVISCIYHALSKKLMGKKYLG